MTWRADAAHRPAPPADLLPPPSWYSRGKAAFDLAVGAALLVLTGPVVLLTAALVKLTSRGPALYSQTRLGLDGRAYTIFKLRTMIHECESLTGARWSTPGDPRVTRLGRFLRASHLDELPQLWNVLRGEMSLVGPRPERPEFFPELERNVPLYRSRLMVKPGMTGLAQVQLPADSCHDSVRRKIAYDLFYVRHRTLWLDFRILVATAFRCAGCPFPVLRRLFGFSKRAAVLGLYKRLTEPAAKPRRQAA